jgi:hypothetical protein
MRSSSSTSCGRRTTDSKYCGNCARVRPSGLGTFPLVGTSTVWGGAHETSALAGALRGHLGRTARSIPPTHRMRREHPDRGPASVTSRVGQRARRSWMKPIETAEHPSAVFEGAGDRPFLVTGPVGSGKTTFLADVARAAAQFGFSVCDITIAPQSGITTLRALMEQLNERLRLDDDRDKADLRARRRWLGYLRLLIARVPHDQRVAIIVDDADRLEHVYGAQTFAWVPRRLPAHVRLVLSSSTPGVRERLLFAEHRRLSRRPFPARASFQACIAKLARGFARSSVEHVTRLLAFARVGLRVRELRDLTTATTSAEDVERIVEALGPFLSASHDVLFFEHRVYTEQIRRRYAPSTDDAVTVHRELARYFSTGDWSDRTCDEAVCQSIAARDQASCAALLANPWFLEHVCRARGIGAVEDDFERYFDAFDPAPATNVIRPRLSVTPEPPSEPPFEPLPELPERASPAPSRRLYDAIGHFRDLLRVHARHRGLIAQLATNACGDDGIGLAFDAIDTRGANAPRTPLVLRRRLAAPRVSPQPRWQRRFRITQDHRQILSTGIREKAIYVWDARTGRSTAVFARARGSYSAVAVTPDGSRAIAVGGPGASYGDKADFALHVWSLRSGQSLAEWTGHSSDVTVIAVASNGRWCVTGAARHESQTIGEMLAVDQPVYAVRVWDLSTGASTTPSSLKAGVAQLAFAPDARLVAIAESSPINARVPRPDLRLIDRLTGGVLATLSQACDDSTRALCVSADGRWIAWFTTDMMLERNELHLFDVVRRRHTVLPQTAVEEEMAMTADGLHLLTLGADGHDAPTRLLIRRVDDLSTVGVAVMTARAGLGLRGHWLVASGHDGNGNGESLRIFDLVDLPRGRAAITAVRQFRHDLAAWDDDVTVFCDWCGTRFEAPDRIVRVLKDMSSTLDPSLPPCLAMSEDASHSSTLDLACPSCAGALRVNPFLIDERP